MTMNYKYHEYIDIWMKKVKSGKVHACKEQKQLMKFVDHIFKTEDIFIDSDKIYDAVDVIEKYYPYKMLDFQRFFIAFVVGLYYPNGQLVFNEYLAMMGRGSGKNGLISAIAFYLIGERHGVKKYNVDIIATSMKQAKVSFDDNYDLIDESPKLQKHFKHTKELITNRKLKSELQYKTSNSKTKDGARPGAIIFDEVHQYINYDNIAVHTGGLGKIPYPRTFYITTDGTVRESVLDDLKERANRVLTLEDHHHGFFPFIFKMDNIREIGKKDLWDKAIPRILHDETLKHEVIKQYNLMLQSADMKEAFLTKRMNIPYVSTSKTVASWEDILATNQEIPDFTNLSCIGAVDFSDLRDFCSVGLLFKYGGKRYFIHHTFIHEKSLELTKFNININEAVELGLATIVKDVPIIPATVVVDWFKDKASKYNITKVVADRYRYLSLKEAFEKEGIQFNAIPNGAPTHNKLNPLITQIFAEHTLVFGEDKLMRWYCNNVYVETDKKGNKTYKKIEPIKRKTDGFFAFLHALVVDEDLIEVQEVVFYDVHTY